MKQVTNTHSQKSGNINRDSEKKDTILLFISPPNTDQPLDYRASPTTGRSSVEICRLLSATGHVDALFVTPAQ